MNRKYYQKYADLYGIDNIIILALQSDYTHIAFREKTIPTIGTVIRPIYALKRDGIEIDRMIVHRDCDDFTLVTNKGYLRFVKAYNPNIVHYMYDLK